MFWPIFLISLFAIYGIISVFMFFMVNSNVIPSRRFAKYEIQGIPVKLKHMDSGRTAYWEAIQTEEDKNVILLHGFTRHSGRMNKRALIYWKRGYNVYFVDNRGHGMSKSILFPSGFQYSFIVRQIIKEMKITNPILHGASMGAIASAYAAQKEPDICKMIICEALPHNFDRLYHEMMDFMKIPIKLFFWIDWLSRKIVW
ncbi:MAG: alpha/beta hydrolase, partial [Candidatus Kariarchaeaceae archaeon]